MQWERNFRAWMRGNRYQSVQIQTQTLVRVVLEQAFLWRAAGAGAGF